MFSISENPRQTKTFINRALSQTKTCVCSINLEYEIGDPKFLERRYMRSENNKHFLNNNKFLSK
jgi:hypothetical protein